MSSVSIVIYKDEWNSLSNDDKDFIIEAMREKYKLEINIEEDENEKG